MGTHLNVAHGVSLLVDVLTVTDHLLNLRALEEVQLQQLGHVLTKVDAIKDAQQLPAHFYTNRTVSNKAQGGVRVVNNLINIKKTLS